MSTRRSRSTAGFTLIEVMAAMVIFLVGIVGILALFATSLAVHRDASQRTIVAIASDEVRARVAEALVGLDQVDSELPVLQAVPIPGYPGYFYSVEFNTDAEEGPAGGILADVFVYATDAGVERGERFKLFVRPSAGPERLIRAARGDKSDKSAK